MTFADLPDALAWLDGHVDFESAMPSRRTLPSLDRMRKLSALLGDPHTAYPVIHITGTNGKGSTAAMVTSLLAARGLRVGTYTSPNLSRVNERIARNGEPIDDEAFTDVLDSLSRIEGLMDEPPTRFELLTAAAFTWFADEAVDVGVVEVGLGGTWDCTNIVHAAVAVITNISYDHTEVLGPTLEDIARDKAGIFTSGCTAVVGETDPGLVALFREAATAVGVEAFWARGIDFACTSNRLAVGGPSSTCARPEPRTANCSSRCTAATRVTTPPVRWPPSRRSSANRSTRTSWRRVCPRCAYPAASRSSGGIRWYWSTGPTTPPG